MMVFSSFFSRPMSLLMLSCLLGGSAVRAADYYTAGFYTRGADTAQHLETGDPVYDPLYLPVGRLALVPRFSLTASHESNLYLSGGDSRSESGTVIRVIPGLMLIYGRPHARHIYLDYGLSIPVYTPGNRLDADPSHLLTLGGVWITPKTHWHTRLGLRRLEDLNTLVGARILKQDLVADSAVEYRVSHKSSVGVLGSYERHRFKAGRYIDYDRLYGAARLYHDLSHKSQVFVQGGIGHDDVDAGSGDVGDADFYDLSLGIRGKPSPKTQATGRVGHQWRTFDDDRRDDIEHWIAALAAEANPFGFTTFSSELFADIRPAIDAVGTSVIDQRLTCSARRRLYSERLRGQASVLFGRIDYRGGVEQPRRSEHDFSLVYDRRQDAYWGYSLGLDWWAMLNFSLGVTYSYIDQRAARRHADRETRHAAAYDAGVWIFRASWNY